MANKKISKHFHQGTTQLNRTTIKHDSISFSRHKNDNTILFDCAVRTLDLTVAKIQSVSLFIDSPILSSIEYPSSSKFKGLQRELRDIIALYLCLTVYLCCVYL